MSSSNFFSGYDVFLSFKAHEDSPSEFISHLRTSLQNAGINVVSDPQPNVVESSRMSIVVFSRDYPSSICCLRHFEEIMKRYKTMGQVFLPVFYDVDPLEVCDQKGEFGKAFENTTREIKLHRVLSWRTALHKVLDLSRFPRINSWNEKEYIDKIVEEVNRLLGKINLFVALHPVGVESRVQDAIRPLKIQQSRDVLLLGIWGMCGIGKTIIAKAIYNEIGCNFEGKSFLPNIREIWEDIGPIYLQEQLLSSIFVQKKIESIESGKIILKENLCHKRVLVVFDDVNKLEQLNTLCGSRKWFGPGSRIIVTTRDVHLLKVHGVDHVYSMKEMDKNESVELFCWHAFKNASPTKDFTRLTRNVVTCCGGLPLALELLGSELHGKGITSWKNVLDGLKSHSTPSVHQILKRNFDNLTCNEKDIFLEIACFFIGKDQNDVKQTLKACGLDAEFGISVLVDRSLVTIDKKNKLGMHVLLQEMGREIIHDRSQKKPVLGTFDVFLSFRGEDTRPSFTSHLCSSLGIAGIYVFRDDEQLQRGERISTSLLQAIEGSKIAIIVFSKNYANSRWCLVELEKIIECFRTTDLVVLPVFYGVDPSDVRHQIGTFGEGFKDLFKTISVENNQMQSWKRALHEASGISGIVILNSRNESEDIKNVVEHVTHLLDKKDLFVTNHPVGIEPRVQDVVQLLNNQQSKCVLLLGIWGMGGIGKTTIAKAIYNQIGWNFEGRSFLLNIREVWEQDTGQLHLQEQLLSDINKITNIKIHNIESGKVMLKERLNQKRILVVLDDVSNLEQLNALSGSHEWFGPGSVIIITTRDESLLIVHKVDHVYRMTEMDENESVELFSWYAFKQASPGEDFAEFSRSVVDYCGGLPLALEVIGSFLFDRGITEWKSVLEKLKKIPNDQVQKKLKISFDGLNDYTEKEIFLDIASFFIGMDRNDVIQILNDCGLFAEIGISVLVERSLVTIDNFNKLGMHDLLRDMGREIIREKSPKELEGRSRLWFHEEALEVLSKHIGTKAIEGLALKLPRNNTIGLSAKAFKKMKRLRLLQLAGVKLEGDFKHISRDLRWLCWHGFPLSYTPTDFHQGSLVAIELEYSHLKLVWKEAQLLEKLKILNLSHSHYLTQTPDFSYLPNLEKLILKDCPSLSTVSNTIEHLNKLLLANLQDCTSLGELPKSIYKLKSLKTLILSGCSRIDKLEEDLEHMESLTTLIADRTAITQVPFAVVRSKSIGFISLCGFEGFSRDVFPSIIWSWMSPTSSLAQSFVRISSLVSLDLPNGSSHALSSTFNDLQKLRSLRFECGSELQLHQDVATILETLYVNNCKELEARQSTSQISNMETSASIDSRSQVVHNSGSINSFKSLLIRMGSNSQVTSVLRETILQRLNNCEPSDSLLLPGGSYPEWLAFNGKGSSVTFKVPNQVNERKLMGMMLCIVVPSSLDMITSEGLNNVLLINHTKNTIQLYKRDALTSFEDEEWQSLISNLEPGNKVEVHVVVFGCEFVVKKTVVYLIYGEKIDGKMEHQYSPNKDAFVSGVDDENVYTIRIPPQVDSMANVEKRKNKKACGHCFSTCKSFVSCVRQRYTETEREELGKH